MAWYHTLSAEDKEMLVRTIGFALLPVLLGKEATEEEMAIWRDVEGPNAVTRPARV